MKIDHKNLAVIVITSVVACILLVSSCASNSNRTQSEVSNIKPQTSSVAGWGIENISPEEAYDLIKANRNNPDFIIIDVRLSKWLENGYIEGAVNISLNTSDRASFEGKVAGLDKNKIYLTYCPDGCGTAARLMNDLGFNKIYDISDGYNSWTQKGLPIVE